MAAAVTFVWWLVVASGQGGMVIMPNPFDNHDACQAAIAEMQKSPLPANWVAYCVPTADQSFAE